MSHVVRTMWTACLLLLASAAPVVAADGWQAGVARAVITPEQPIWMSGYAGRSRPAQGKLHDLWAKALCVQDPAGRRVLLITLDLVGIDRDLSLAVRGRIERQHGLKRSQIALATSHTHTGPVVGRNLTSMYFYGDEQRRLINVYTDGLADRLVMLAGEAIADLSPCTLAHGAGRATFAVNRRTNREADVPALREKGQLKGPVDHDVPVLRVTDAKGRLKAVVFGYACHATTLSFYQWSGDYPGFAQIALEKARPGLTAMFFAGCGADQNPLPRRTVERAENYGRALADAVTDVIDKPMRPVKGRLHATYAETPLPFAALPSRQELTGQVRSNNRYVASRARRLLQTLDERGALSPTYPMPVQTWRLGDEVLWLLLGGEVVVDYALRIKRDLGHGVGNRRVWAAAYVNDVMAYIPSRRVLKEGGYEGGGAMVYYGLPGPWDDSVEDRVMREVTRQAGDFPPAR